MNASATPLSYGVRQAIRDSPGTTYEIGKQSKVSPQNLYRFLDDEHPRALSQKSLDALGVHLKLTLVKTIRGQLTHHAPIPDKDGKPLPEGTPLTDYLRRAFEVSRKVVPEVAREVGVSTTQFYRFLDRSRGLSQEKLDRLCGLMGLVVEGPPDAAALRSVRKGAMYMARRKTYTPPSRSAQQSTTASQDQASPPVSPPSLFVPPEEGS